MERHWLQEDDTRFGVDVDGRRLIALDELDTFHAGLYFALNLIARGVEVATKTGARAILDTH